MTAPTKRLGDVASGGPATIKRLGDVADVVRSKNAGPFAITFDVLFRDREAYERVRGADVLNAVAVAQLFGIEAGDVTVAQWVDAAQGFKATVRRRALFAGDQGGVGERDTFGTQQHAPLMELPVPIAASDAAGKASGEGK